VIVLLPLQPARCQRDSNQGVGGVLHAVAHATRLSRPPKQRRQLRSTAPPHLPPHGCAWNSPPASDRSAVSPLPCTLCSSAAEASGRQDRLAGAVAKNISTNVRELLWPNEGSRRCFSMRNHTSAVMSSGSYRLLGWIAGLSAMHRSLRRAWPGCDCGCSQGCCSHDVCVHLWQIHGHTMGLRNERESARHANGSMTSLDLSSDSHGAGCVGCVGCVHRGVETGVMRVWCACARNSVSRRATEGVRHSRVVACACAAASLLRRLHSALRGKDEGWWREPVCSTCPAALYFDR
jgi:hypothetical protein